jgi:hypothetical protein
MSEDFKMVSLTGLFIISLFFTFAAIFYIGSPSDQYFRTLKTVMDCRQTVKPQNVAELDAICGKIPQISDFVKEDK